MLGKLDGSNEEPFQETFRVLNLPLKEQLSYSIFKPYELTVICINVCMSMI